MIGVVILFGSGMRASNILFDILFCRWVLLVFVVRGAGLLFRIIIIMRAVVILFGSGMRALILEPGYKVLNPEYLVLLLGLISFCCSGLGTSLC